MRIYFFLALIKEMDVSAKLNALLPNLPIKGEPNNAVVPKKVSYSKTSAVVIPKIQKIDAPTPLHSAENAYDAVVKGAPNTITDKYVKIGNAMIPGDFFIPLQKVTPAQKVMPNAKVQAAIKINKSRELLQEGDEKQSSFKFEQYLSEEKKSEYERIMRDFNSYRVQRGLTNTNENKDVKMLCLLNALNLTVGNINIFEPYFIDAALLCRFQEYNGKNTRTISYLQPNDATLDYVMNNNLFGALKVKYDGEYNFNAQFSYFDVSTRNKSEVYEVLTFLFGRFTQTAVHSQKLVLVAAPHHLGDSEEEYFKIMGIDIFARDYGDFIAANYRFHDAEEFESFYNRIFSVSPPEIKVENLNAENLNITQDRVEELLRESNEKLEGLRNDLYENGQRLNHLLADQQAMMERGERLRALALDPTIEGVKRENENIVQAFAESRAEVEYLKATVEDLENALHSPTKYRKTLDFGDEPIDDEERERTQAVRAALGTIDENFPMTQTPPRTGAPPPLNLEQLTSPTPTTTSKIGTPATKPVTPMVKPSPRAQNLRSSSTHEQTGARSPDRARSQERGRSKSPLRSASAIAFMPGESKESTGEKTGWDAFREANKQLTEKVKGVLEEAAKGEKPVVLPTTVGVPVLPPVEIPEDQTYRKYSEIPDSYVAAFIKNTDVTMYENVDEGRGKNAARKTAYTVITRRNINKPYPEFLSAMYTEANQYITENPGEGKAHEVFRTLSTDSKKAYRKYLSLVSPGVAYTDNQITTLLEQGGVLQSAPKLSSSDVPQSSSSTVQGSGFIKGGSLSANELAKFHKSVFIKKLQKIKDNVFMFTF